MKKLFTAVLFLLAVSLTAQVRLYTPEPDSPKDGDDEQNPDVAMSWLSVSSPNQINYKVEYSVTGDFSVSETAIVEMITGYAPGELDFGQTYYWHVKAIDAVTGEESAWSETYSFTVFEEIDLKKPSDGSDDEEPVTELEWDNSFGGVSISGIEGFQYAIDTTEDFSSPYMILDTAMPGTGSHLTPELLFGKQFFWKMRAFHAKDTSIWSEIYNFWVVDEVELNKPNDNSDDLQLNEEFSIKTLNGVLKYEVQYDISEEFTEPFKVTLLQEEGSRIYTTFDNLTFGLEYFWRARAIHRNDTSGWSEVRKFSTIVHPVPVAPENGLDSSARQPVLEWEELTGIDFIEIEYALDEGFTEELFTDMIVGTRSAYPILYPLKLDKQYFWRVRAIKVTDSSAWSPVWSFTVTDGTGINEINVDNVSTYPNPIQDELHLSFAAATNAEATLTVYDLAGKKQKALPARVLMGDNHLTIDMTEMENGIYMIKLEGKNILLTRKVLISK